MGENGPSVLSPLFNDNSVPKCDTSFAHVRPDLGFCLSQVSVPFTEIPIDLFVYFYIEA